MIISRTLTRAFICLLTAAALACAASVPGAAQVRGTEAIPAIEFKPGVRTATLTGTVSLPHGEGDMHNDGADRYSFSYKAGQRVTVNLKSEPGGAVFTVYRMNGESLSTPAGVKWSGRLPGNGDYIVRVFTNTGTARYTLKVSRR